MEDLLLTLAILATGIAVFQAAARLGILGLRRKRLAAQKSRVGLVVSIIFSVALWAAWYVVADVSFGVDM
jgi:hypothetical protein